MEEQKRIVRVAVSNNFNCTQKEYKQLKQIEAEDRYDSYYFTNSNINTPALKNINKNPYKAFITLNPNLNINQKEIDKLAAIDKKKIGAVRVKYLPNRPEINKLIKRLARQGYKVLITIQRFNGRASLAKYTDLKYYTWSHNRYRLNEESLKEIDKLEQSHRNIYVCDRKGLGCQECGNCAKLSYGKDSRRLASLNLSTSGLCKFSCPDCYAQTFQHVLKSFHTNPIAFDIVKSNMKQKGKTKHILDTRALTTI